MKPKKHTINDYKVGDQFYNPIFLDGFRFVFAVVDRIEKIDGLKMMVVTGFGFSNERRSDPEESAIFGVMEGIEIYELEVEKYCRKFE